MTWSDLLVLFIFAALFASIRSQYRVERADRARQRREAARLPRIPIEPERRINQIRRDPSPQPRKKANA